MRNRRHRADVQHFQARITDGFAKKQLGIGPHGGAPAVNVAGLDKRGVNAKAA